MNWTRDQYDHARDGPKQGGTLRVSAAEGRLLLQQQANRGSSAAPAKKPEPKSKLGNVPTEYKGVRYDSKAEANRARTLDYLQLAGDVVRWERQVAFELWVAGALITTYILDFRVYWADGRVTYEDVKGQKSGNPYKIFLIKQRLMKACLNIDVTTVK